MWAATQLSLTLLLIKNYVLKHAQRHCGKFKISSSSPAQVSASSELVSFKTTFR